MVGLKEPKSRHPSPRLKMMELKAGALDQFHSSHFPMFIARSILDVTCVADPHYERYMCYQTPRRKWPIKTNTFILMVIKRELGSYDGSRKCSKNVDKGWKTFFAFLLKDDSSKNALSSLLFIVGTWEQRINYMGFINVLQLSLVLITIYYWQVTTCIVS